MVEIKTFNFVYCALSSFILLFSNFVVVSTFLLCLFLFGSFWLLIHQRNILVLRSSSFADDPGPHVRTNPRTIWLVCICWKYINKIKAFIGSGLSNYHHHNSFSYVLSKTSFVEFLWHMNPKWPWNLLSSRTVYYFYNLFVQRSSRITCFKIKRQFGIAHCSIWWMSQSSFW